MIYSEKLKDIRESKNLTQKDLGKILNIRNNAYAQYEKEYVIIPLKHLNTLCNYLNVSLDYIFGFNVEKNYSNYNNEINQELYSKRIKEFRKEHNLTQNKLADILNTTQSTLTGYECGRYLIATPFLYTICKKYYISADYLLGKIDEPKYLS